MYIDLATQNKLKLKYGSETVFVVPSHLMSDIKDKFVPATQQNIKLDSFDKMGIYVLRCDAEMNNSFQQLIPYVIIKNKRNGKYFVAKRKAGDERLVNTLSLGFGGHIDKDDGYKDVILRGLEREIHEELSVNNESEPFFLGTIRDFKSATADHTGFVFEVKVTSAKIKEKEKLQGVWMTPQELVDNYFLFENWSKYYIDYLFEEGTF